jgi:hypothetical protein
VMRLSFPSDSLWFLSVSEVMTYRAAQMRLST